MKRPTTVAAMLVVLALASMALAQGPGDIGIFFDPGGTQSTGSVLSGVPFFLYVVAFDIPGDTAGLEGSLQTSLLPGLYFVLTARAEPANTAVNLGGLENWIVATGVCYPGSGPTVLLTLQLLAFAPGPDEVFCIGPSTPSSFSPPTPGYVSCISPVDLHPFGVAQSGGGVYPDACAVGNPAGPSGPPIATDQYSWSAVKARY